MRFYWLLDQEQREQFDIMWGAGKNNLADYMTKHHPASRHQQVRPIYLYEPGKSPETVQGCVEILNAEIPKKARNSYPPKIALSARNARRKKVRFSYKCPLNDTAPTCSYRAPTGERKSILRPSKYGTGRYRFQSQ